MEQNEKVIVYIIMVVTAMNVRSRDFEMGIEIFKLSYFPPGIIKWCSTSSACLLLACIALIVFVSMQTLLLVCVSWPFWMCAVYACDFLPQLILPAGTLTCHKVMIDRTRSANKNTLTFDIVTFLTFHLRNLKITSFQSSINKLRGLIDRSFSFRKPRRCNEK